MGASGAEAGGAELVEADEGELPVPVLEAPELPCPGAEEVAGALVGVDVVALAEESAAEVAAELEAGVVPLAGVLGVLAAGVAGWDGLDVVPVPDDAELAGGVDWAVAADPEPDDALDDGAAVPSVEVPVAGALDVLLGLLDAGEFEALGAGVLELLAAGALELSAGALGGAA